jgi:uncharacterized protein YdcH (DUF465 family)
MTVQDKPRFSLMARRIVALRAKDPYFDALCETYADLDSQIGPETASSTLTSLERERLKRQRSSCLDTILFMLDDANSAKYAA